MVLGRSYASLRAWRGACRLQDPQCGQGAGHRGGNHMTTSAKRQPALQRVSLEMSLKPFKSMVPEAVEAVCAEAIRQWLPLIGMADSCSVLLWVADGSEILVWDGDMQRE